jgi:hypothetical protein
VKRSAFRSFSVWSGRLCITGMVFRTGSLSQSTTHCIRSHSDFVDEKPKDISAHYRRCASENNGCGQNQSFVSHVIPPRIFLSTCTNEEIRQKVQLVGDQRCRLTARAPRGIRAVWYRVLSAFLNACRTLDFIKFLETTTLVCVPFIILMTKPNHTRSRQSKVRPLLGAAQLQSHRPYRTQVRAALPPEHVAESEPAAHADLCFRYPNS